MPRLHLHPPPPKPCVYVCVVGANQEDQECAPWWTHCTRTTAWPASAGWETAAELLVLGRGRRRLRKLSGASRLKLCFALEEEAEVEELVEEEVSRPSAPSARSPAAQIEEASDWLVRLNQSSQSVTSKHQVNT